MNELRDTQDLGEGFKWEKGASKEDVAMLYTQLTSTEASNREQKAEIERLKALQDENYLKATQLGQELASLRASVGEKPEDAWKRAWSVGYVDALNNVDVLRPKPYVAPTLPGEEK